MAFIIDDILLAPAKFAAWIGRTIHDQAEAEITDESVIHGRLMDLQTRFELGEMGRDEFIRQEDALMRRLGEIHKYKESRAKA